MDLAIELINDDLSKQKKANLNESCSGYTVQYTQKNR